MRCCRKELKFQDLGLLVVDEEQRFGVRHKERLKQMRAAIDVLSHERDADSAHAAYVVWSGCAI